METTVTLSRFDLGMRPDPRDRSTGVTRVLQNFDTAQKQKLTPHRDMVMDALIESTLDDDRIIRMLKANGNYYGFGQISADNSGPQVFTKVTPSDPTAVWTAASNGSDATHGGSRNDAMFHHYKATNKLYGGNAGGIWSYDLTTRGFTYDENTSIVAGPTLTHSKDDCMYVLSIGPSAKVIARNNAGSWNNSALTLPSDVTSGDICEYGNYLSIAVNRLNGNVVEYLWDRDSSLTTLSESIDWGIGTLLFIENLGGVRVGVFLEQSLIPKLVLKYYTGVEVVTIAEFVCSSATIPTWKQKYNNAILFLAELMLDGTPYKGLWKLEKTASGFTFALDRLPRNDTTLDDASLKGFYRTGDYVFISYLTPTDGEYTIWRTNDQASYTALSIVETMINPGMPDKDRSGQKKLMAVSISTEPLPDGAEVELYYRADGGGWLPIVDQTEVGSISTETAIDLDGEQFTDGREYEFAISSTGGAAITELKYKYRVIPTLL